MFHCILYFIIIVLMYFEHIRHLKYLINNCLELESKIQSFIHKYEEIIQLATENEHNQLIVMTRAYLSQLQFEYQYVKRSRKKLQEELSYFIS